MKEDAETTVVITCKTMNAAGMHPAAFSLLISV